MMTSYFNLLKYAATGIASPGMTYYDRMRASMLMGGAVQTLTDVPPLSFKANGKPLISWSMKGNAQQTGTPTPDNPVMPEFVGVRTGNLFDISSVIYRTWTNDSGVVQSYGYAARSVDIPSSQITVSFNGLAFPYSYSIVWVDSNGGFITRSHIGSATQIRKPQTFTPPSNAAKFYIQLSNGTDSTRQITEEQIESYKLMLNLGSTALPYEPYGYKIPLTCAGQTTPVYLGEVPTVRRVKKLVLDGTEKWYSSSTSQGNSRFVKGGALDANTGERSNILCTHLVYNPNYNSVCVFITESLNLSITMPGEMTAADFKSYLTSEYAAGAPVTVWYALATPETGITNEPLCKIGTYADELSSTDAAVTIPTAKGQNTLTVETDLQPSEMSITYKG